MLWDFLINWTFNTNASIVLLWPVQVELVPTSLSTGQWLSQALSNLGVRPLQRVTR